MVERPVLAPSDLRAIAVGTRVLVGGRVRLEAGRPHLVDALASCAVEADGAALEEGQLAVVEGDLEDTVLRRSTIRWRGPVVAPGPDVARLLGRGVGRTLDLRARAVAAVRAVFASARFVEVETPARVPCPGLDVHLDAFEVRGGPSPRWLSTSPEYQMKRLLVGGIPRCFQLARCFRREELGTHHEPEFTMLEWYRGFGTVDEVIADTEAVCVAVAAAVGADRLRVDGVRDVSLERPFPRISVAEAFAAHARIAEAEVLRLAEEDETRFFRILVEQVEPALATMKTAVVLHRYPAPFASLARLCDDDPRFAERFEVYAGGVELCNGFGELTDAAEQRARFERDRAARAATGRDVYPLDERFLGALVEGMPPAAGNALGFDRLLAAALGVARVADVMALPEAELGG
jgi:lysyl-tRNA synthetase class 2